MYLKSLEVIQEEERVAGGGEIKPTTKILSKYSFFLLLKDLFNDNMTWESISRFFKKKEKHKKLWNKNEEQEESLKQKKLANKKKGENFSSDFLSCWQYNYWLESGGVVDVGGGWEQEKKQKTVQRKTWAERNSKKCKRKAEL